MSWSLALDRIKTQISQDDLERWIAPLKATLTDQVLILWAPNAFVIDKVESDFAIQIREATADFAESVTYRVGEPRSNEVSTHKTDPGAVQAASALLKSIWSDDERGMPADFARSALFATARYGKDDRPQHVGKEIYAQTNMRMSHTGPALTYHDEDVYLAVLHMAREFPIGDEIVFSLRDLAQTLNVSTSGPSLKSIEERLYRLHGAKVEVEVQNRSGTRTYSGYLISSFARDETLGIRGRGQSWALKIDRGLTRLLTPNLLTRIEWDTRKGLQGGVAKRLHAYYASYAEPYPVKVETLVQLCAISTTSDRRKRQLVTEGLDQLEKAGFLLSWMMDSGGLVRVKKAAVLEG